MAVSLRLSKNGRTSSLVSNSPAVRRSEKLSFMMQMMFTGSVSPATAEIPPAGAESSPSAGVGSLSHFRHRVSSLSSLYSSGLSFIR